MQTPKARNGPPEVSRKVSPRPGCRIKTIGLAIESGASNQPSKTPTDRSPKVAERRSPRSSVLEKKRSSRVSELESQVSHLQDELKKAKDELSSSVSETKQSQQDTEEYKKQLSVTSLKLENEIPERKRQSEIEQLKAELQAVSEPEDRAKKQVESANVELERTKESLVSTLSLVEKMRNELKDGKESEAEARALASETLLQLESAKKSMESLKCEGMKATEAYKSVTAELERSRARVNSLEGLVSKLEADLSKAIDRSVKLESGGNLTPDQREQVNEVSSLKDEVGWLRSALEAAETKYREEQVRSSIQVKKAQELAEQIISESSEREAALKANLMDKELNCHEVYELEEVVSHLKAHIMDKETELQNISKENEMLRMEIARKETNIGKIRETMAAELEAARASEQEVLVKLGLAMEEADKSKKRASRVMEQLEAAQAAKSEIEAELRRVRVQCDQWRKAAEAAAAMLSTGHNGRFMSRTGSNDVFGDFDDDLMKKKNANMLKRIGMLWKKPHS